MAVEAEGTVPYLGMLQPVQGYLFLFLADTVVVFVKSDGVLRMFHRARIDDGAFLKVEMPNIRVAVGKNIVQLLLVGLYLLVGLGDFPALQQ